MTFAVVPRLTTLPFNRFAFTPRSQHRDSEPNHAPDASQVMGTVNPMFDQLEEQMRRDDLKATRPSERLLEWIAACTVSVLIIAGLYALTLL